MCYITLFIQLVSSSERNAKHVIFYRDRIHKASKTKSDICIQYYSISTYKFAYNTTAYLHTNLHTILRHIYTQICIQYYGISTYKFAYNNTAYLHTHLHTILRHIYIQICIQFYSISTYKFSYNTAAYLYTNFLT